MFVLPDALACFAGQRKFIAYRIATDPARPGKTNKFPVDLCGIVTDASNPAIWMSWQDAAAYAELFGPGHGVGFVFTPGCGLWFIDVDDCLEANGAWSSTALALMERFAGAAWEISASGRGLHGFGRGVAPSPRKIKYGQYFDLYTENRFVALTGTAIVGNADTDHTPALVQLVADFLTRDPNEQAAAWTTAPRADWRGNTDDDQLIARALSGGSVAQKFGSRASFSELWNADADALAKFWPETNPAKGRAYGASHADSALAQALAFWTGNDCERIERLMRRSALVRDKWDHHSTYLRLTITNAVGRQHDVLKDKLPESLPQTAMVPTIGSATAKNIEGSTYITPQNQIEMFKGCVYIENISRVLVPGGRLLKSDQFKVMYGGYSFVTDLRNETTTKDAWEAFTQSQALRFPKAHDLCFRPECEPGIVIEESGRSLANSWWPIQTLCTPGDATPFIEHLKRLFPDEYDRATLTAYLAAIVQHPGVKFQWAPLIQGIEGNGKTLIVTAIRKSVGDIYTHLPNANDLAENGMKFSAWLRNKLFIGIEEIHTNERRNMVEILKPLITNSSIEIQAKGQDQITGDNRANIIACSNHKDAIPKSSKDRRWGIYFTAQQDDGDLARDGMDGDYMPKLWTWCNEGGWGIINYWLKTYQIPDELNPAVGMHRAPATTSTAEAIELSAGFIEQELSEAIEQGLPGFAGGWVSSMCFDKLLVRIGADRRMPPRKRHELLVNLGYEWHPALKENRGRVNNSVEPDGGKTRLWIKKGSILKNLLSAGHVSRKYVDDQKQAIINKANFGT